MDVPALPPTLQPVTLESLESIHACLHRVVACCAKCGRWVELDLARLIRLGHGLRTLATMTPRCLRCRTRGTVQLHPPTPKWDGYPRHGAPTS